MPSELYSDKIRIVYHHDYQTHYTTASCETPARVKSIMEFLDGRFPVIQPEECTDEDILLCHSDGLLTIEKQMPDRYHIARLAAGGAITAAHLALEGFTSFAAIRPPGHHANPDHNWGFCFFNNMAIAIMKLLSDESINSATILDIDLHFGDGTDTIFKSHNNINVLNIQSSNPDDFVKSTESSLKTIDNSDIIAISAGFDQYEKDWGANLSTDDYRKIGVLAGEFARSRCNGRIFTILEGGYYIPDLGINVESLLMGIMQGLS